MKSISFLAIQQPGFSKTIAQSFVGKTTKFIDEKNVEHDARVIKARYVPQEGIYITLELPDEASIETMKSSLGVSIL